MDHDEIPTIIEQCKAAMPGLSWAEADGETTGREIEGAEPKDCAVYLTVIEEGEGEDYRVSVHHQVHGEPEGWGDGFFDCGAGYLDIGREIATEVRRHHEERCDLHAECASMLSPRVAPGRAITLNSTEIARAVSYWLRHGAPGLDDLRTMSLHATSCVGPDGNRSRIYAEVLRIEDTP